MWVGRGIEVALFALVLKYASLHIVDQWPPTAQWVFGFVGKALPCSESNKLVH